MSHGAVEHVPWSPRNISHGALATCPIMSHGRVSYRGGGGGAGFPLPSESSPHPQNFESLFTILYGFMVLGESFD